jgi:hypothetical protein
MHISTKIIKILLIYIENIHTQVSNIYPPPPLLQINTYHLGSVTCVNMDTPQEVSKI